MSNGNISLWELPTDISQPMPKEPVKLCAPPTAMNFHHPVCASCMSQMCLACEVWYITTRQQCRYMRKKQAERTGHWIVRSCFGGCNESFVLSGSEECKVQNPPVGVSSEHDRTFMLA